MPPRLSRSRVPNALPKPVRSKTQKRSLDVYATAAKDIKEKRIPQHRLGEDLDDEPRHKRRRTDEDDDDEEGENGGHDDESQERRQKRRAARLSANADDDIQYGSDSSGHEWTIGGLGDDDDDSELDSDEAFGDSDEERFEGFTFRGSRTNRSKSKRKNSRSGAPTSHKLRPDLNEETEEEEDDDDSGDDVGAGLGEDAVDLAAMLDDSDEAVLGGKDRTRKDAGEESASDEDEESQFSGSQGEEEDEDEEDEEDEEDDQEDSANEERVARMMDRLENLDTSLRPRQHASIRRSGDLTFEDLLSGVDGESRKRFAGEGKAKRKSTKSSAISAPLPKRQQDRLDREAATQQAKEQLDRWRDTVIRNRRAEFLSFPMADPNERSRVLGKEKFIPANQGAHKTELEESIQRIMEESGLSTKNKVSAPQIPGGEEAVLLKSEELATNKLPIEEVMRRRGELRKARELLFREEIKARRIAKIKSKSYRRVHRKERERLAEQERQALEGLGGDDAMDSDDIEKLQRRRAEARVATKHKDSKWAKALKATNRTVWDENARDSVIDQVKRNEELKRRIAGKDVSFDSSGDSSGSDGEDEEEDAQGLQQKLEYLKQDRHDSEKGLSGLKFMRSAEERMRRANDEDIERLRKELAIEAGDENEEDEVKGEGLGRAVFGPQSRKRDATQFTEESRLEFEAPDASDAENEPGKDREISLVKSGGSLTQKPKSVLKGTEKTSGPLAKAAPANTKSPWISHDDAGVPTSDWLSKQKNPRKQKQASNEEPDLNLNTGFPAAGPQMTQTPQPRVARPDTESDGKVAVNSDGWTTVPYRGDGADGTDSEEPVDPILSKKEQREALQRRAFAGDDVQVAFDSEKAEVAESEDEKEISNHLPGWGSWTGDGLSRSIRKANQRAKHNPLFKSKVDGVRQADRKDASLENVIISEKHDRKGKKYLAPILPHGYETKAQYERSRRLPMGPEWSTKEVHQRMTRPRVVVKPGVRLDALERPLV